MKSPITGKDMKLSVKDSTLVFRKETFHFKYQYYWCEESKEEFTTTALDELNLNQVYNQYRDKHNLPFTDEIIKFRKSLCVSAKLMSKVFGFGTNSYRNYENGEVPSLSNGKMIYQSINNIKFFKGLVEDSNDLKEKEKTKLLEAVKKFKSKTEISTPEKHILALVQKDKFPSNNSGYKKLNLEKFSHMVCFFAKYQQPSEVKLNKLLFYADFLHFSKTGYSISGSTYRAIDYGPVPNYYDILFNYAEEASLVKKEFIEYSKGIVGKHYSSQESAEFNKALFSDEELDTLQTIAKEFKDKNASEIKDISHKEEAWINNNKSKSLIDYDFAFKLKALKVKK